MNHKHEFRATNNNSVGFYGILLYCTKCGKAYSYNSDWEIYSLKGESV